MSEKKFTPGPWSANHYSLADCNPPRWWSVVDKDRRLVCDMGDATTSAEDSNAHLIAAAPDLYDALEALLFCAEPQNVAGIARARCALAKARGEA